MSHSIAAFIARRPLLDAISRRLGDTFYYALKHPDFLILPVTDDAFDHLIAARGTSESAGDEFWRLTKNLCELAAECSTFGPVAYVETDYFGGQGTQAAAAWAHGKELLSPSISWSIGPINTALNIIGIQIQEGQDEFDTVGLGDFRRMDAFLDRQPLNPTGTQPSPALEE